MGWVGSVRVVAGKYKGRRLETPGAMTHPMGERERNALFNMVDVEGKSVADVFAGSGAIGIEALSRGAAKVMFLENNAQAARTIRENLARLSADGEVIQSDAAKYFLTNDVTCDIMILDPPYTMFPGPVFEWIQGKVREKLIISSPSRQPAPEAPGLRLADSRTYAGARISVYVPE